VTSLSGSSEGEVGDFWEKLMAIIPNNALRPVWSYLVLIIKP